MNQFYMRLPRNGMEGALFTVVVLTISVNTIAPIICFMERGFTMDVYIDFLKVMPIMMVAAAICVTVAKRLAYPLKNRIIAKDDSFSVQMIIGTLCIVFFMSMFMSIVGATIGTGVISVAPFETFIYKWPRNFGVALFIEICVAQPVARYVMLKLHIIKDEAQAVTDTAPQ